MTKDETREKAQVAFVGARIKLLQSRPFYAYLVMKLNLEWLEGVPGGLSATDGESLFINPKAFLALPKEARVTCLVHETLHCAWGHLARRGSRDPQKWNIAADICIDNQMRADRFQSGPWEVHREAWLRAQGLSCEAFEGKAADEVYEALPNPPQSQGGGRWKANDGGKALMRPGGEGGCCLEPKGPQDAAKRSELEAKWRQAVVEAAQVAGNAPGAWQELVKAAMPKPPFTLKLFEYLSRGLGGDTSWDSFQRRYLHAGMYLPSSTRVVMGRIACFVDTSGSMSSGEPHAQLNMALGYVRSFRDQHPCDLDLVQCDYDVPQGAGYHFYPEFEQLPAQFEIIGRGGTSFDPPFNLLREKNIEPRVAIYFTDGYGGCSVPKPRYPVLWVVIGGSKEFEPPFGEVIHVKA